MNGMDRGVGLGKAHRARGRYHRDGNPLQRLQHRSLIPLQCLIIKLRLGGREDTASVRARCIEFQYRGMLTVFLSRGWLPPGSSP